MTKGLGFLSAALASAALGLACGGKTSEPAPPAAVATGLGSGSGSSSGSSSGSGGGEPTPPGQATAPDAGSCTPVTPAQYDTSCAVDSDCVAVGSIATCPANGCDTCELAAINKSQAAAYMAAFQAAFTSAGPGEGCGCPCSSGAVCRSGICQAAFCGPPPGDTLAACADAGGQCSYAANTTCSTMGPANACAYSDEICCVN